MYAQRIIIPEVNDKTKSKRVLPGIRHPVMSGDQKMSDSQSFDSDLKLIKAVQKRPYLYDKNTFSVAQNESYIANAWSKISKEVKLPQEQCTKQWKYLRTRYTRSPHSSWELAPYLSFLEPFINRRPKKDKSDLPDDSAAVTNNAKQTGNQSKGVPVQVKPSAPSKVTKKGEKKDNPVTSVQPPSTSSMLEMQSNQSFCESLSNDLQTLTAEQRMKCRIDILQLIDKYKNPTINKKKPKVGAENDKPKASVSDISKKFAGIVDKLSKGSMTSYDQDWMLIFATKNFFCELMDMRKANVELDRMLPLFKCGDSADTNDRKTQVAEKQSSLERPSLLETQNNLIEFTEDAEEPMQDDDPYFGESGDNKARLAIKTEPGNSEAEFLFSSGDASISALENLERENETHDTLKDLYLTEGMMKIDRNRFLCLLCDVFCGTNFYSNHTQTAAHQVLMKEYAVKSENVKNTAIPQLDPAVYSYQFGGLYCIKCDAQMSNRNNFLNHMKSLKHKNQVKKLPIFLDQDMFAERDVGKGIVQINASNFCVLCDVKIFGNPSIMHATSSNHQKAIALVEGLFKMTLNHGYCTHCNDVFPLPKFDFHIKEEKHVSKVMDELDVMH